MRKVAIAALLAATMAAAGNPAPAQARNGGAVAAGIIGGLAVGTMLGAAAAQPRYYGPPPVYVEGPVSQCYWTRGRPIWDPAMGIWRRPRIQVCD